MTGTARGMLGGLCLAVVVAASGCGGSGGTTPDSGPNGGAGPPRGLLAVSANTVAYPPAAGDVLAALAAVYAAGAHAYFTSTRWSDLEPSAGRIDLAPLAGTLNTLSGMGFRRIEVGIQVINTVVKETPPDLQGVAFDAPLMKARFHTLLDAVLPLFAGRTVYLSIGNEVDAYLNQHQAWAAYEDFFNDAVAYVHQKAPAVPVGVTVEWSAASGASAANVRALTAPADVLVFTYYNVDPGFHVLPALAGPATLDAMVAFAGTKPVVVQELGMPTDASIGGTPQAQADFVSATIGEYARIGSTKMPMLNFFALYDFPPAVCDQLLTYYGSSGASAAPFRAYLCSLGLRDGTGADKPAWPAFKAAAAANGFD